MERGEDVCEGEQRADVLYTEADGVWVHLQREERTHYEVKSGIAYRGWRRVGENRNELVGKRVYGHASESILFWEGASLEWAKQYALERSKLVVVGGDGADWIHKGSGRVRSRGIPTGRLPSLSRVWSRLRQTDRSGGLRWNTCRINGSCARDDVFSPARTDRKSTKRQSVCGVQPDKRDGLAQAGV